LLQILIDSLRNCTNERFPEPELWLEPRDNWYGREYLSGRIRLAMARGNKELFMNDQKQSHIGERRLEAGCLLGMEQNVRNEVKDWEGGFGWSENFHVYSLTWTPGTDGMCNKCVRWTTVSNLSMVML
jgi:hypothetical protein